MPSFMRPARTAGQLECVVRTSSMKNRASSSGPKVLASVASTIFAFALSRGLSVAQINEAAGIGGLDVVDPFARLPDECVARLLESLTERNPGKNLTLAMARAAPFSILGGLAHGMQFANNLREAMHLLITNRGLLADRFELSMEESETEAVVSGSHPADKIDRGRATEVGIALASRLITEALGVHGSIARVEFRYPPAGPASEFATFFNVPVLFEQPRDALVLHSNKLDSAVSQSNVELFNYVQQHFEQILRRVNQGTYPARLGRLREAIAKNVAIRSFGTAAVAARARMSLRSAQRLAKSHSTTLTAMIQDVRFDVAKRMLLESSTPVETVSDLVGYSDARTFRRAFKRWTGQTPVEFRHHGSGSASG